MSFSGSLIQNAIYIAQEPPEWPITADDWERAAEEKSMTAQLVGKMLSFFGVKAKQTMNAKQLEENASLSPFS